MKTEHKQEFQLNITCFQCGQPGTLLVSVIVKARARTDGDTGATHVTTHHTVTEYVNAKGKVRLTKSSRLLTLEDSDEEVENSFTFDTNAHAGGSSTGKPNALLVDCGATTHIINDEAKFSKFDDKFTPEKYYIELADGTQSNNVALKRGDVEITIMDTTGKYVNATLNNALNIPAYPQNIFSVQAATERGATVTFNPDSAKLVYKELIPSLISRSIVDCTTSVPSTRMSLTLLTIHVT